MNAKIPRRRKVSIEEERSSGKSKAQRLREVLPLAWTVIRPRVPSLALGLFLILVSRGAGMVLPGSARVFVDDVVTGARPDQMRVVLVSVVAAALVQAACSFLLFRVMTL